MTLREIKYLAVIEAMRKNNYNQTQSAHALDISTRGLHNMLIEMRDEGYLSKFKDGNQLAPKRLGESH